MTNRPASHYPDIGVLGEEFVAQWLHSQGWIVLHRRWRCPWGELDLIAKLDLSNEMTGKQAGRGNNSTYDLRLTTLDYLLPAYQQTPLPQDSLLHAFPPIPGDCREIRSPFGH